MEFPGPRAIITYENLNGVSSVELQELIAKARAFFEAKPEIESVCWKTYGHDGVAGLHAALVSERFAAEDTRTMMIGDAELLVSDVALPPSVKLRRITQEDDVLTL